MEQKNTLIIIVILITAIIVGGVVYFWQKSVFELEKQNLEQQINDLQIQILQLKKVETSNEFLEVDSPTPNQEIQNPIQVSGNSNFFEGNTRIRIKDDNNKVLADTFTQSSGGMGIMGSFSMQVFYEQPSVKEGIVEIFDEGGKDGSDQHKIGIPVIFSDFGSYVAPLEVKVYFIDRQMMTKGTADYEDMVKPVTRSIPYTKAVATAAIEELLRGPTVDEILYITSIPSGVKVNSLKIENGVAYVDFNQVLGQVAGSATVNTIKPQIEKTLKQFTTINRVVISIEGQTEGILQP